MKDIQSIKQKRQKIEMIEEKYRIWAQILTIL